MSTRRLICLIILACAAGTSLAACGSSSSSSTPKPSATAKPTASSSVSAEQKAISADWVAFFNPKTPVSQRVALLENGSTFASVIKAQASSSLASSATATVSKVTVTSPSQAAVTYTILVSGSPALKNQSGVAVYQDGTWKVGVASFCGLLTLENGGKTSGLPAACKSAM